MSHEDKAREIVADYGARWFRAPLEVQEQEPWLAERITTALQEAAGEWYRIDDPEHPAPKDGTRVLGAWPRADGWRIDAMFWMRSRTPYWMSFAIEHVGGARHMRDDQPTHWRPLPPPPSDKGGA